MKLNKIKTIAVDVDGTLHNSDKRISQKTKEALLKIQKEGVHLVVCSGRPIKSMLEIAKELELDKYHGLIISNNGAIVYDVINHKKLHEAPIDHKLVVEILENFEGRNIWPMIEDGDYMLVKDVYEGVVTYNGQKINLTQTESRAGNYLLKEAKKIQDEVNMNVNKILTIVEPSEMDETLAEFQEKFGDRLYVVQTSPFYMEFMRPEVNKAFGLEKIGIDPETLMTFGDSMNDLEMLKYSKYPIAMGNAQEPLKEEAVYITADNDHDGIYEALKHFGLV